MSVSGVCLCASFVAVFTVVLPLLSPFSFLADAQAQLAVAVEKERSATEELRSLKSQQASLESQNSLMRQEKARFLAQLDAEKSKREKLEDESSRLKKKKW